MPNPNPHYLQITSAQKKHVLAAIDRAVEADKLNEFVLSLVHWLSEETQIPPKILATATLEDIHVIKTKVEFWEL